MLFDKETLKQTAAMDFKVEFTLHHKNDKDMAIIKCHIFSIDAIKADAKSLEGLRISVNNEEEFQRILKTDFILSVSGHDVVGMVVPEDAKFDLVRILEYVQQVLKINVERRDVVSEMASTTIQ